MKRSIKQIIKIFKIFRTKISNSNNFTFPLLISLILNYKINNILVLLNLKIYKNSIKEPTFLTVVYIINQCFTLISKYFELTFRLVRNNVYNVFAIFRNHHKQRIIVDFLFMFYIIIFKLKFNWVQFKRTKNFRFQWCWTLDFLSSLIH